ncbi:MAG: hypothetical protein ACOCYB_12060 [Alkalispirochaeta sp.]
MPRKLEQRISDAVLLQEPLPLTDVVQPLRSGYHQDMALIEEHLGSDWVTPDGEPDSP